MIKEFVKLPSQLLLVLMGWRLMSADQIRTLRAKTKTVYIYPHTSYWDFVIGMLYTFAHPEAFENSWALMKPQPFRYIGRVLRWYGFIPATKKESGGMGFVDRTARFLKRKDYFNLFISPEGTRTASPWKSGYYYLARALEADIDVFGFDYEKMSPVLYSVVGGDSMRGAYARNLYPGTESILQKYMRNIVPLYPSSSFTPIRAYKIKRWIKIEQLITLFPYILLHMIFLFYVLRFLT